MTSRRRGTIPRDENVITAADVVLVLRRGLLTALLLGALGGVVAYYSSTTSTPIFSARVGVVASQPDGDYDGLDVVTPAPVDAIVYQRAILSGGVAPAALNRLEGEQPSAGRLRGFLSAVQVNVENARLSSTVWIEVRNASPEFAAAAANAIASELIEWDRERGRRAVVRSIDALERSIAELRSEIEESRGAGDPERAEVASALLDQRVRALENARQTAVDAVFISLLEPLRTVQPPSSPISPTVPFDTFVGALLGLIAGYGIRVLMSRLDPRIGDGTAAASEVGLSVLAEFPPRSAGTVRLESEAAGFLHTNVAFATRQSTTRSIVVTSPVSPTERAGVALSLAERFSRSGQRTLLVDADLRHASVTAWIGDVPSDAATFAMWLAEPDRGHEPLGIAHGQGREATYDFIPGSISSTFPPDLLNAGVERCLHLWRDHYDVVVLDAAPVVPVSDTLALARYCSSAVLCVEAGRSTRDQLKESSASLDRTEVDLLGVVVTNAQTVRTHTEAGRTMMPVNGRSASGPQATSSGRT